jgi:hypothetical protein
MIRDEGHVEGFMRMHDYGRRLSSVTAKSKPLAVGPQSLVSLRCHVRSRRLLEPIDAHIVLHLNLLHQSRVLARTDVVTAHSLTFLMITQDDPFQLGNDVQLTQWNQSIFNLFSSQ